MAKPPISAEIVELLKQPNPAVMATVDSNGAPVTVATWYLWDEGRVLLNLEGSRKRLEHLRADPRVSLTVLDGDSWYRHVSVQGTVTLEDDPDMTDVDRLSQQYLGQEYPIRDQSRVTAWMDIDSYHAWDVR